MTEYSDDDFTSKTQQKREDNALHELGLSLMNLKPADQGRLPLSDSLIKALEEAKRITSNEARRRHAQFVGRLVRESDSEAIISALEALNDPFRQQRLSNWVEEILSHQQPRDAEGVLQQILAFFPHGDRQQLRSLVRNLFKARVTDPAQASGTEKDKFKRERRKLMNYLNELDKNAPLY
ncbi:MAG: ribosome biogenesis factor YjgA [Alcanivorax sp.]|nr:ribosome biogenesis factor YjgA [Alcanivorax sp.]